MRRWWTVLLLAVVLGLEVPAQVALAGPRTEQKAEVRRLTEELKKLAERSAWSGVERTYLRLVTLERKGAEVSHDAHRLGAQSAEARGAMLDVWRRLRAAQAAEFRDDTASWLATVQVTYDRVVIEVSPLYFGDLPLEALDLGFDPSAQRTVATARDSLDTRRVFDGLLPLGRYRVAHVPFEVVGLGDGQRITVWPEAGRATARSNAQEPSDSPTELVLQVTAAKLDRPAYDGATRAVATALEGLDEVSDVVVVPLPPQRLYVDYEADVLENLSLTADDLLQAIRQTTDADSNTATLAPRWLEVDPEAVSMEVLEQVEVTIIDSPVSLISFTQVREAPRRSAPPPGLSVTFADGVDPARATLAVQTLLEADPSAALLGLVAAAAKP